MDYADSDLRSFLLQLDKAPEVEVNDWEAKFIESTLANSSFSPKQRAVVLNLIEKYGKRIKW